MAAKKASKRKSAKKKTAARAAPKRGKETRKPKPIVHASTLHKVR